MSFYNVGLSSYQELKHLFLVLWFDFLKLDQRAALEFGSCLLLILSIVSQGRFIFSCMASNCNCIFHGYFLWPSLHSLNLLLFCLPKKERMNEMEET